MWCSSAISARTPPHALSYTKDRTYPQYWKWCKTANHPVTTPTNQPTNQPTNHPPGCRGVPRTGSATSAPPTSRWRMRTRRRCGSLAPPAAWEGRESKRGGSAGGGRDYAGCKVVCVWAAVCLAQFPGGRTRPWLHGDLAATTPPRLCSNPHHPAPTPPLTCSASGATQRGLALVLVLALPRPPSPGKGRKRCGQEWPVDHGGTLLTSSLMDG